ncbi:MAG: 23S rRNA (adenine(2503)-C(2))-methyltransferase RlmN [Phycisphaerales bacterium]|nr:23S rRNA (adenine(2503)-C(2))-methyltransferase RlmN [Phycisphaerales bacterium]
MDSFFSLNHETLSAWIAARNMPRHTTDQLFDWVYRKKVSDPTLMTNLSRGTRAQLSEQMVFTTARTVAHQTASDGTNKMLLSWAAQPVAQTVDVAQTLSADTSPTPRANIALGIAGQSAIARGEETECVMIPTEDRRTACISSQLGCPVRCTFCASGIGGFEGNLTAAQIIEQVFHLTCLPRVERITHIVFMGMGEPLANYDAVTTAIRTINAPWGFGVSARRITLSTVGLPAAIRKFCEFEIPVTLALSLHAPNDILRRAIIPWAEFSTIDELLDACDEWFRRAGREITLEYILLGGVNDRPEHAEELATHALRIHANVNLIRYNEVKGLPYQRPATEDVLRFQNILRSREVNVHIRASRGRDISAACGQLRHEQVQA